MKTQRQRVALIFAAFTLLVAGFFVAITENTSAATPGVVSIDFVGSGAAMGAAEIAGVVPRANWNNATGASRSTPLALVDETGTASGASVTWVSNSVWSIPITDQAGNRRMMRGYLDSSDTSVTSVTVTGLPSGAYDVYVFADGDNGIGTRTAAYAISGAGITTTTINLTDAPNANFNTAFTQANNSAGNYVKFSITAGGFTLTATPGASDGNKRAPVNGIQIVPAGPPAPDFTVTATPASQPVTQGNSTSYAVTIGALNGFAGTVNMSVTGLPANATGLFAPASVPGSGNSTLTVTTASNTPIGSPTLTITGTSGALTRSTTVTLVVSSLPPPPDFTISITPASRTVSPGSGASFTVSIGALNGFSGTVNLGASGLPANATPSFTPSSSISGSGSVTMNVATAAATPTGSFTLTVAGSSGSLNHAATAVLVVSTTPPGGVVSVNFVGSGTAMGAAESAGVVARTNWNNAIGASSSAPLGLVNDAGVGSGATVTWNASSVSSTPITDQPGNRRLMKGLLNTSSSSTTTLTVAGLPAGFYDVYVYADGSNGAAARTGAYRISGAGITTTTINLTDAANTNFNTTFTQANNSSGNYVKFSITASGFTLTATPGASSTTSRRAPVNGIQIVPTAPPPPDFTVTATPGSRTVTQGNGTSYTVAIGALNGFAGAVDLSVTGLPSNATGLFAPTSVNGSGQSTLTVTTAANTPTGSPTLTIKGTSGALSHTTTVSLVVNGPTFSISGTIAPAASGASATVNLGGTATATTTASGTGAYSFSGLANGPYAVMPSKAGYTFNPTSANRTVNGANVTGVDFTATQSTNSVSISSPANGSTVSNPFSISATASGAIVGVQFQVDGANAGPEDTGAPFSASVTASSGGHTLTAVGRDASGNTVTSAPVNVTVNAGSGTALTINGAQTFQTMDGFGVNLNSLSWNNGELAPALDMLVDQLGAKTWRVVFDMEDWESSNDNSDPNVSNATYYNALYSNAKFQNLWGTLHYLNQKGITSGLMLSFMGRVPTWMGGAKISSNMEDEWVEMIASLLDYARNTENVQLDLLDPINEPDWDGFEGPQVDQWQYPRLLAKLAAKLDSMNLSSFKFVGPNTASVGTGVDAYIPEMLGNSVVMNKLDHFGLHNYTGVTGGADARIKGSAYPSKGFVMTELSIPEQIFTMIGQGAAGTQIWDAYDSVYNHAILAGAFYNDGRGSTPPNDAGNMAALMSYNGGAYTPRPQFYQAQAFKYVSRGSIRIAANESSSSLTIYAFRHPTTGRVTIVGRNISSSSITVNGSLSGVGSVSTLQFYQTGISNNYSSFQRGADVVVTGGAFTFTAPVNSYFTLTTP